MNKNTDLTFNKLFSLFFLLILASCSNPDPISTSSDKLIKRNNVSFFEDSNTPFTGEVVDYHSNKNLKMTGNFIDGKKEGQWNIYFFEPRYGKSVKEFEEFYTNGKKNGKFIRFEPDGKRIISSSEWSNGVFKETLFFGQVMDGSGRTGSLKRRIYHKNNKIYQIKYPETINDQEVLVDKDYKGKIYCQVTDKQTNFIIKRKGDHRNEEYTDGKIYFEDGLSFRTWKDCELNGETEDWTTGRTKKGFYKDDRKTGKWTYFDFNTGGLTKIENYKEDKLHGLVQEYDNDGNGILLYETEYIDGKKDGLKNYYNEYTNKLNRSDTYVQDDRKKSVFYTNLNRASVYVAPFPIDIKNLYDFWYVMTAHGAGESGSRTGVTRDGNKLGWKYISHSCDYVYRKNSQYKDNIDCMKSQTNVIITLDSPIKITANYQGGFLHGSFEISDPDDGHIYTSIEYFRGGKYGEYKITNKEGNVVFSVNCLKGGGEIDDRIINYTSNRVTFTGKCRKDGEEVAYRRSIFSPNQDWVLYSKKIIQNDEVVEYKYFIDPYYQEGMISKGKVDYVVLPFVKDPSLIVVEK